MTKLMPVCCAFTIVLMNTTIKSENGRICD